MSGCPSQLGGELSNDRVAIDRSNDVRSWNSHGSPAALAQHGVVQHQVWVALAVEPMHDLLVGRMVRHVNEEGPRGPRELSGRACDNGCFDPYGRVRVAGSERLSNVIDRVVLDVVIHHDE